MEPPYRNLLHMGNDQSIKELQLERHLTFRLQQRGIYHGWLETQVTVHMSTQIITDFSQLSLPSKMIFFNTSKKLLKNGN